MTLARVLGPLVVFAATFLAGEASAWGGCSGDPFRCPELRSSGQCAAQLGCNWVKEGNNGYCSGGVRACNRRKNELNCGASDVTGCKWNPGAGPNMSVSVPALAMSCVAAVIALLMLGWGAVILLRWKRRLERDCPPDLEEGGAAAPAEGVPISEPRLYFAEVGGTASLSERCSDGTIRNPLAGQPILSPLPMNDSCGDLANMVWLPKGPSSGPQSGPAGGLSSAPSGSSGSGSSDSLSSGAGSSSDGGGSSSNGHGYLDRNDSSARGMPRDVIFGQPSMESQSGVSSRSSMAASVQGDDAPEILQHDSASSTAFAPQSAPQSTASGGEVSDSSDASTPLESPFAIASRNATAGGATGDPVRRTRRQAVMDRLNQARRAGSRSSAGRSRSISRGSDGSDGSGPARGPAAPSSAHPVVVAADETGEVAMGRPMPVEEQSAVMVTVVGWPMDSEEAGAPTPSLLQQQQQQQPDQQQ
mmetsp:Transcript_16887/g.50420  ORF Transcript_16887/g.50420 Transcript_16887/m.50420 type:complete len:474 (-) Transcript_16887:759-2180(-)